MKKAKIMLLSVAVLAVVGGALAFKAQKFATKYYCFNKIAPPISGADINTTCTTYYTLIAVATEGLQNTMHYSTVDTYTLCTTNSNDRVTCPLTVTTVTLEQ